MLRENQGKNDEKMSEWVHHRGRDEQLAQKERERVKATCDVLCT